MFLLENGSLPSELLVAWMFFLIEPNLLFQVVWGKTLRQGDFPLPFRVQCRALAAARVDGVAWKVGFLKWEIRLLGGGFK